MPPINKQKSLKQQNNERKLVRKKRRERTLLKAVSDYKNNVQTASEESVKDKSLQDKEDVLKKNSPCYTVSIAVPGSILTNAQSLELKTYLAGRIARAACIYHVDEVIVFDDTGSQNGSGVRMLEEDSCEQLARYLQYMECPQYLRKFLFPLHKDLKFVGITCPLDAPHHLRQNDDFRFREGVVTPKHGKCSYVNVGLLHDVHVDKALMSGTRVTVHLKPQKEGSKKRYGEVVPPSMPREVLGVYWGYSVRLASSLSEILTKSPYEEGYDLTIGTSDKGVPITECAASEFQDFKHILIVFGGLEGLEAALENDENLNIDNVSLLFDKYLNTCPNQGTRTIRTEEAVVISLATIIPKINHPQKSY